MALSVRPSGEGKGGHQQRHFQPSKRERERAAAVYKRFAPNLLTFAFVVYSLSSLLLLVHFRERRERRYFLLPRWGLQISSLLPGSSVCDLGKKKKKKRTEKNSSRERWMWSSESGGQTEDGACGGHAVCTIHTQYLNPNPLYIMGGGAHQKL